MKIVFQITLLTSSLLFYYREKCFKTIQDMFWTENTRIFGLYFNGFSKEIPILDENSNVLNSMTMVGGRKK